MRALTDAERAWATEVFGGDAPWLRRVRISGRVGVSRRAFTLPLPRRTVLFLGRHAGDPVVTAPGLFAHELTHAWQWSRLPRRMWWWRALTTQARYLLGHDVYAVSDPEPWERLGFEQQATAVERWATHRPRKAPPPHLRD